MSDFFALAMGARKHNAIGIHKVTGSLSPEYSSLVGINIHTFVNHLSEFFEKEFVQDNLIFDSQLARGEQTVEGDKQVLRLTVPVYPGAARVAMGISVPYAEEIAPRFVFHFNISNEEGLGRFEPKSLTVEIPGLGELNRDNVDELIRCWDSLFN